MSRNDKDFLRLALVGLRLTLLPGLAGRLPALGQEVSLPDAALDSAVREALGWCSEPLTVQAMSRLTNLEAARRGIM
jgi:hypothetical protein